MMLFLVAFLIILNGLFVAAEFALVKVRQSYLEQLENEGNKKATITKKVTSNLNVYLNVCQFGITLASLALGWVGEPAVSHLIEPIFANFNLTETAAKSVSFIIAFSLVTFLHIVIGEIVPKTISINKSDVVSLWTAPFLLVFYKATLPFVWFLNISSNVVLKLIGMKNSGEHEIAHTEEELRILMTHSHESGHINETEMDLIEGAFDFADKKIRQVMVPRVEIVTLNINDSYDSIMKTIKKELYTRYPVVKEDKDNIVGYVHIKDLIICDKDNFSLEEFIRRLEHFPESMEISDALNVMKKQRIQIGLVIDEYGGTAGIVTMEDLLEEIVDEIQDEFDTEEILPVVELPDGYSVDGRVLIGEVNDLTGLEINDSDIDTIAGYLYQIANGDISEGYSVDIDGVRFSVVEMKHNHVSRIIIQKI